MKHLGLIFTFFAALAAQGQYLGHHGLPADAFTVSQSELRFVTESGGSIPMKCWGGFIHELKPLRVYLFDPGGIRIVTEINEHEERGILFVPLTSSLQPVDGPGEKYRWNKDRGFLEYVRTR